MYQDASQNPLNALGLVSNVVDALFGSLPSSATDRYVSVGAYNALVQEYNDLACAFENLMDARSRESTSLKQQLLRARLETCRLTVRLAAAGRALPA